MTDEYEIVVAELVESYPRIVDVASDLEITAYDECEFNASFCSRDMSLTGAVDLLTPNSIVTFTFTEAFKLQDRIGLYLRGMALDPHFKRHRELVNLNTGHRERLVLDPQHNWSIFKECFRALRTKVANAVILYDFETTGIDTGSCDIIDRHFLDIDARVSPSSGLVKSAFVPREVEALTGISTQMLANADSPARFRRDMLDLLEVYDAPCLVAHNGAYFDDKILLRYMGFDFCDKVRFADSMRVFSAVVPIKSKKLQDFHSALFGNDYVQTHRAEGDVLMIDRIINHPDVRPSVYPFLKAQQAPAAD